MKWGKWIENWDMTSLKINTPFLEMEWNPQDEDKDAAWELYIELLTRVTTQSLKIDHGDEQSALLSIHSLFDITRNIIKSKKITGDLPPIRAKLIENNKIKSNPK